MPSLLDIGKLTRIVTIRGVDVEVRGLSGLTFLHLLDEFPELRKMMAQGGSQEPDPAVLLQQAPGAVASAVASACGYVKGSPDWGKALEMVAELSLGEQMEILLKVWELTFPKGIQNFIDALEKLAKEVVGAPGWVQATKSPGPSSS